jgi:hypothetical protein
VDAYQLGLKKTLDLPELPVPSTVSGTSSTGFTQLLGQMKKQM